MNTTIKTRLLLNNYDKHGLVDSSTITTKALVNKAVGGRLTARKTVKAIAMKRPKVIDVERHCPVDGCNKLLSQYNQGPFCYTHSKAKFGRVRGRVSKAS